MLPNLANYIGRVYLIIINTTYINLGESYNQLPNLMLEGFKSPCNSQVQI